MKVYVVGYKAAGFGGKIIKWFTCGEYSHVSLLFNFDLVGVEIESIQGEGVRRVIGFDTTREYDLFEVECEGCQAQTIYSEAASHLGKKYDWSGIWSFLRKRKRENPNKWFCSELVAHCLKVAGIELMRLPAWKQSPVMVCSSVAIKPVSKGE